MTWTLSYCTLDRSPMFGLVESLEEQVRAAAAAGFSLVTADVFSLRAYRDSHNGTVQGLRAVVDECGLATYDLSGVTISDDAATSLRELDEFLTFARELDARWIQSRLVVDSRESRAIYAEAARRVADAGFGFAFEYSPFVPVCTLRAAAALVGEIAQHVPGQSVIVDTWHFFRTGDTYDDLRSLDPALFGYVQLDDAVEAGPDMRHDTLHRRALPGHGILPLGTFLDTCEELGLTGVLSVEVLNDDLRALPTGTYAHTVADATNALLAR